MDKLCKDCKFFKYTADSQYSALTSWGCRRDPAGSYQLPQQRELDYVFGQNCGPEGKYWEER